MLYVISIIDNSNNKQRLTYVTVLEGALEYLDKSLESDILKVNIDNFSNFKDADIVTLNYIRKNIEVLEFNPCEFHIYKFCKGTVTVNEIKEQTSTMVEIIEDIIENKKDINNQVTN